MTTLSKFDDGLPCWVDNMVASQELHHDKRAFLSALFDWTWQEGAPETSYYALALSNGQPVLGMGIYDGVTTSAFQTYFSTSDIEASVARALELGATSAMPVMAVMDLGTMTMMNDPEGATFGLWQPGTFHGFGVAYEENTPGWFDHASPDPQGAGDFYASLSGNDFESTSPDMRILRRGEQWYASMSPSPPNQAPQWSPIYIVDALERVHEIVRRHGGTVLIEEMPVPGSAISTFIEPVTGTTMTVMRAGAQPEQSEQ
ncbi:MAG TPA: VOC family protein [Acidimicrobiales bacterium]|nr:VOC family protein [Acidimicrobiales bacterium]